MRTRKPRPARREPASSAKAGTAQQGVAQTSDCGTEGRGLNQISRGNVPRVVCTGCQGPIQGAVSPGSAGMSGLTSAQGTEGRGLNTTGNARERRDGMAAGFVNGFTWGWIIGWALFLVIAVRIKATDVPERQGRPRQLANSRWAQQTRGTSRMD